MRKIHATWVAVAAVVLAAIAVNALEDVTDEAKLSVALAQAREQRLADLHVYAEAGIFPHNHGHLGQQIPYFMDRHGRLCAVGYLVAKSMAGAAWDYPRFMALKDVARTSSGRSPRMSGEAERIQKANETNRRFMKLFGFFNDIATTNNNIRIKDVQDGPVLDWILRSGLTQEEAAIIQPGYSYLACDDCLPGSEKKRVTFGALTRESQRVEEKDRVRIRAHLLKVERMLRDGSVASLRTCAARLRARGPVRPWTLKLQNLFWDGFLLGLFPKPF